MKNLQRFPAWRPEHLGQPLPESDHAASVALPTWSQVVDYEENDPATLQQLRAGYPRFRIHRRVQALAATFKAPKDWRVLPFPSAAAARRALSFVHQQGYDQAKTLAPESGVYPIAASPQAFPQLFLAWRHFGEIVSSRQADKHLRGLRPTTRGAKAKAQLMQRLRTLAGATGAPMQNAPTFLFPTGMAALAQIHRVVAQPDRPSVQFGFPYVDTLCIQQKSAGGVLFLPHGDQADLDALERETVRGPISAIFCECPTNPLLRIPDLQRLRQIAHSAGAPLIVDNTLDSFNGLCVTPYADVVVTSLTKYFAGSGDVMGGSLLLNPNSPFFDTLHNAVTQDFEDLLWDDDALALETHSRNYLSRMRHINANAAALVERLRRDPRIAKVHYPDRDANYPKYTIQDTDGVGGLLSFTLKDAEAVTPAFYDALRLSKGPSLGTSFTLVCPYTMLCHYRELAWAESCDVSRWLIRISVGLEPDLTHRVIQALDQVTAPRRKAV